MLILDTVSSVKLSQKSQYFFMDVNPGHTVTSEKSSQMLQYFLWTLFLDEWKLLESLITLLRQSCRELNSWVWELTDFQTRNLLNGESCLAEGIKAGYLHRKTFQLSLLLVCTECFLGHFIQREVPLMLCCP